MADTENGKTGIFISFASQERSLALYLREMIIKYFPQQKPLNMEVFVSDSTITAGELWENEIRNSIERAKIFFVLCSPLSIDRQWVSFECGAASFLSLNTLNKNNNIIIVPVCFFGLSYDDLPLYLKSDQTLCLDGQAPDFLNKAFKIIRNNITGVKNESLKSGFNIKDKLAPFIFKKDDKSSPKYIVVDITKHKNHCSIKNPRELPDSEETENKNKPTIKKMHDFIVKREVEPETDREATIKDVGIAIGIQNCIFDGTYVYVGVRMKSLIDAYSSSVNVAKGQFNTGYELLKKGGEKKIQAIDNLQDQFVNMPSHIKHALQLPSRSNSDPTNKTIYDYIKHRIEAVGGRLWSIGLGNGREGVGTIFVNNSKYFSRFEIGIWKYIDISDPEIKYNLEKEGLISGFGEDIFLDYRGRDYEKDTPVNYWIWVRDNEIFYWSYPEERLISRRKPARHYKQPMHAVLVTRDHMILNYGNRDRYTPFTSFENLRNHPDEIISEQFSFPARALLSCF